MTADQLEKLTELEKDASPGPWYVIHPDDDMHMGAVAISLSDRLSDDANMRTGTWPSDDVIAACLVQSPPYATIRDGKFEANAALIAEMRNNFAELLRLAKKGLELDRHGS